MADGQAPMDDQRATGQYRGGARKRRADDPAAETTGPCPTDAAAATAASALVAILVAVTLGALFNAYGHEEDRARAAVRRPAQLRLALLDPLASVSHWLFLDR